VRKLIVAIALLGPALGQADYLITSPESLMTNQADYLVVTHQNFTASMLPLCRLRESLGLAVKMAELPLIYSTFNSGPRTDRIKAFLHQVYYNWTVRPTYVLLVGDACKDSTTGNDLLPCKVFPKFSYGYYSGLNTHSIDNWYAQLEGNDSIPDLIVGRLPVSAVPKADSLVAKILRYETSPDTGRWVRTAMLVASDDRANYARELDTLFLRPNYDSVYTVYEAQGSSTFLRQMTRDGFNQGAALLCQSSHGGQPPQWCGSKTLLYYQDADSLRNLDCLPIVLNRG
jgi:hypothetical protein